MRNFGCFDVAFLWRTVWLLALIVVLGARDSNVLLKKSSGPAICRKPSGLKAIFRDFSNLVCLLCTGHHVIWGMKAGDLPDLKCVCFGPADCRGSWTGSARASLIGSHPTTWPRFWWRRLPGCSQLSSSHPSSIGWYVPAPEAFEGFTLYARVSDFLGSRSRGVRVYGLRV